MTTRPIMLPRNWTNVRIPVRSGNVFSACGRSCCERMNPPEIVRPILERRSLAWLVSAGQQLNLLQANELLAGVQPNRTPLPKIDWRKGDTDSIKKNRGKGASYDAHPGLLIGVKKEVEGCGASCSVTPIATIAPQDIDSFCTYLDADALSAFILATKDTDQARTIFDALSLPNLWKLASEYLKPKTHGAEIEGLKASETALREVVWAIIEADIAVIVKHRS
ncbi:MAG: hypothetical protein WC890_06020 [Candidatus Margulisiibacteriota bacterium]